MENFPDLEAIAKALADQIQARTGIRSYPYVPDNLTPTAIVVELENIANGEVARSWEITWSIWLIVGNAWDRAAQKKVRELTDTVRTGIRADDHEGGQPHLGGLLDDIYIDRVEIQRQINVAEATFSGERFVVESLT